MDPQIALDMNRLRPEEGLKLNKTKSYAVLKFLHSDQCYYQSMTNFSLALYRMDVFFFGRTIGGAISRGFRDVGSLIADRKLEPGRELDSCSEALESADFGRTRKSVLARRSSIFGAFRLSLPFCFSNWWHRFS